jgi:hypothetical protein
VYKKVIGFIEPLEINTLKKKFWISQQNTQEKILNAVN